MPTGTKSEKAARRRKVAGALVAGKPLGAAAQAAGCSKRHVQRLEREPETQFLIAEALRPHQKLLTKMAGKAIKAVERSLTARKTDGADRIVQLRAVERYGELMALAQGKETAAAERDGLVTWEEFVVLFRSRRETHEAVE